MPRDFLIICGPADSEKGLERRGGRETETEAERATILSLGAPAIPEVWTLQIDVDRWDRFPTSGTGSPPA